FAERWSTNPSPNARRLLLAYLERPLNAYRHEPLVKRLFKRAETAGDDAVMARLLVAFDRSIRRGQRPQKPGEAHTAQSHEEAQHLVALWTSRGFDRAVFFQSGNEFTVWGTWSEPHLTAPGGTTMPRGELVPYPVGYDFIKQQAKLVQAPDWVGKLELDPR